MTPLLAKIVADVDFENEPLTLAECYRQLRIDAVDSDGHPEDDDIMEMVSEAREYCEAFTGLSLAVKDYEVVLNAWPDDDVIVLPNPPFIALLNGITIDDTVSDNAIDEDSYTVDDYSGLMVRISPVSQWPTLASGNVIRIRYRAGYGDQSQAAADVPRSIKRAMRLLIGHWYQNREAVGDAQHREIPLGVEALLRPHRVLLGMA